VDREPIAREVRRAALIRVWTRALLNLALLVVAGFLYFHGGLAFKLLAFVVLLPAAVVGRKEWSALLRGGRAGGHRRPTNPE
jgi:hypothetical protein